MKKEYPPLLPAGFHDMELGDLRPRFVAPMASTRRGPLVDGLERFLDELRSVVGGIEVELWLDGSFATEKPDPDDIDVLVVADGALLDALPDNTKIGLQGLLKDPDGTKARYGCQVYFSHAGDASMLSYWRGWFGFSRDEAPKGIPRLRLA